MVSTVYNNELYLSIDGGESWSYPIQRLEDAGSGRAPFISQIGYSPASPDRLFVISASGVSRSENFGQSWQLSSMTDSTWNWGGYGYVEPSIANPDIVWAASLMEFNNTVQVSTDGGKTFHATNNYSEEMGLLSGLSTHPHDPETVFALFSYADYPKILRSTDLGQNWEDITGFETAESNNGFPNVAVYSLLVMPYDTNEIWAGTEIGLFISYNNGVSWEYAANGLPAASIWEMKIRGDQVVLATHGRGIWTVDLPKLKDALKVPVLLAVGTSPSNQINIKAQLSSALDSVSIIIDSENVQTFSKSQLKPDNEILSLNIEIKEGRHSMQLISNKNEKEIK